MTGNGPVNLSLLSRGVGEISKNGHEKVDVVFEPEDYFNWANNPDKVYLPPIRRRFPYEAVAEKNRQTFEFGDEKLAHLPKTYTTRKGALLLFSEDLATKTRTTNVRHRTRKLVTHSVDDFDLRTVDDLAKSILSYGKDAENSEIYLGFVHPRKWYRETRRIRPGFSAKRYLSTWTQSWDDSLLHKLLDKGHLTDSSLQQMDPFIPHRRLRLYDDLSHCPAPYRLLRSMLISPGSLAGYTFYRVRPESQQSLPEETELYPGEQQRGDLQIPAHISEGKIKVVQSKHGVMKEVEYKELERQKQEEVLTELLVKSAIHQALKQQQEYVEESIGGSQHGKALSVAGSIVSQGGGKSPLPEFDMKEAVDSLLDSQKGKPLLDGSIISSLGQKSVAESRGSLRGRSLPSYSARSFEAPKGRPNSNEVPIDGHFPPPFDTASVTSSRSGKLSLQQATQLPPIEDEGGDLNTYTVLPPIGDIGEGEAEETLGVPMVNIEPPTPQHSTLTNLPQSIRGAMSREPSVSPAKENDTQEEEPGDQWGSNVNESDILAEEKQTSDQRRQSEASEKQSPRGQSVSSTPRSKGPVLAAGSHLQSSRENLAASSSAAKVHLPGTLPGWRASQQSIKSASKHTASSPREGSLKGSVVYGPDGEVINVGGAVTLRESPVSVPDINKLLDGAESVLSEDSGHLSDDEGGGDSFRSSSHQLTQRHQKRASGEDVNAQMSMHSWSYSPKDGDGKSRSSHHSDNQSNASDDSSVVGIDQEEAVLTEEKGGNSDSGTESLSHFESMGTQSEPEISPLTSSSRRGSKMSSKSKKSRTNPEEKTTPTPLSSPDPASDKLSVPSMHAVTPRSSISVGSQLASLPIQEETDAELTEAENEDYEELKERLRAAEEEVDDTTDGNEFSDNEMDKLEDSKIPKLETCSSPTSDNVRMEDVIEQAVDNVMQPITGFNTGRSRSSSERVASLAEQGLIDALTEHAQRIAASVLDQNSAGVNLADDIKTAAALWMANHPQTVLSRSQSMQEFPNNTAAQEIARSQKRKSAAPTVAEYKELIRKTLSSAVAHQMGIEDGELPADTEISQDLMEALTNKSLTPDELEVVRTESGRSIIRAKSGRSEATPSPLKDGHLYQPASRKGSHSSTGASPKPPISIPNDRQHTADVGELDVLNLGFAEQEGGATESRSMIGAEGASPALSAKSGKLSDKLSIANGDSTVHSGERSAGSGRSGDSEKSKVSATEAKTPEQELAEIMKELEAKSPGGKSEEGRRKSKSSEKSKKSRNSLDGRDEFVVGKVENKKELEKLYAPLDPPPPKKDTKLPVEGKPKAKKSPSPKKGKKTKKKEKKTDKDSVSSQDVTSSLGDKPPSEVVVVISDKKKSPEPISTKDDEFNDDLSDNESPSPSPSKSESEDFTFIREDTEASPSPEPDPAKSLKSAKSAVPSPATLDITDDGDLSDSSSSHPNQISNKDARAAKRAAQAEKRRLEVEKKRKEREEQLKREKEEMDRQEQLNREMEETRRRKAEERRLEKLRREEEADREEAEEIERQKRKQQEAEREKRQREEYQRKLEEHKRKQAELDRQRMEEMLQRQKEEEERRLEEERMLYEMAEHERIAYEKKKKEDAERRKLEEEAARIRREEEAARALEEARKLAEEMARKQAELEARLKFNRGLMLEAKGMGHTQDITRAFVYSYFELLQWLGLDIPEFDMQKLQAKF